MSLLWSLSVFVLGFVASVGQVLLLRALLATFHGNELTLGVGLALWMAGTASGGLAAARGWFGRRAAGSLGVAFLACSLAVPAAAAMSRLVGAMVGVGRGELAPLSAAMAGGLLLFLPVSSLLGAVFTLSCRVGAAGNPPAPGVVGRAYLLDAVGATAGGLTAAFLFIPLLGPLPTAAVLSTMCLAIGLAMLGARRSAVCAAVLGGLLVLSGAPMRLDRTLVDASWPGYELLASRDTAYQSLVIAKRQDQVSLFSDGTHVASFPEFETPELLAHLPLLQHPSPSNVLLIGGGVTGVLTEVLRHEQVKHVDYIELDPWVIRLATPWLPEPEKRALAARRVRLLHLDGRLWVRNAETGSYDVLILQLPDPHTANLNRFYTSQFFAQAARTLRPGGVLALRASSAENYLTHLQSKYLGTLLRTMESAFTVVRATPGAEAILLARDGPDELTLDPATLLERLEDRGIEARYVNNRWLPYHLTPDRLGPMAGLENRARDVNTDFRPICYFYSALLWSRRQGSLLPPLLAKAEGMRTWQAVVAVLVPSLLLGCVRRRRRQQAASYCLLTVGAATIMVQIVLLVAYQAISGYVYSRVSLFTAFFMGGLAVGAGIGLRLARSDTIRQTGRLLAAQTGMTLWCLVVAGVLYAYERAIGRCGGLFLGLALPTGLLAGLVFPLANALRSRSDVPTGRLAASSYALDLAGAALGTALGTILVIPVLGLMSACATAAALSAGAAVLLATGSPFGTGIKQDGR